jgi:signal transduction histidine kinase
VIAQRIPLRTAFLATLACSAAVLLLSAAAPERLKADRQLEVLLHGGAAFAALAAAQLVLPRLLDGRATSQAALGLACVTFAAGEFAAASTVSSGGDGAHIAWSAGSLAASAYLAWSALATDKPITPGSLIRLLAVGVVAIAVALVGVAEFPAVVLFFAAALGFAARALRSVDFMTAGLSSAAILALYSALDRLLLSPSGSVGGATLGLGCGLLLLGSATLGARLLWERRASEQARAGAADALHGGVAQELALLVMVSKQRLGAAQDDAALRAVLDESERALDETRHLISTLRRPADAPLAIALANEGREVAYRVGLELALELDEVEVAEDAKDAITLILREGLALAATEYGATAAVVTLAGEHGAVLRIRHDGKRPCRHERLAELESIERRARSAGGQLVFEQDERLIEVTIP